VLELVKEHSQIFKDIFEKLDFPNFSENQKSFAKILKKFESVP